MSKRLERTVAELEMAWAECGKHEARCSEIEGRLDRELQRSSKLEDSLIEATLQGGALGASQLDHVLPVLGAVTRLRDVEDAMDATNARHADFARSAGEAACVTDMRLEIAEKKHREQLTDALARLSAAEREAADGSQLDKARCSELEERVVELETRCARQRVQEPNVVLPSGALAIERRRVGQLEDRITRLLSSVEERRLAEAATTADNARLRADLAQKHDDGALRSELEQAHEKYEDLARGRHTEELDRTVESRRLNLELEQHEGLEADLRTELDDSKARLKQQEGGEADLRAELDDSKARLVAVTSQLHATSEAMAEDHSNRDTVHKKLDAAEKRVVAKEEDCRSLRVELKRLGDTFKSAAMELAQKDSELTQQEIELELKAQELAQKDSELEQKDIELAQKDRSNSDFMNTDDEELEEARRELDVLKQERMELGTLASNVVAQLAEARRELESLREEAAGTSSVVAELAELAEARRELETLRARETPGIADLATLREERDRDRESARVELAAARREVESLREKQAPAELETLREDHEKHQQREAELERRCEEAEKKQRRRDDDSDSDDSVAKLQKEVEDLRTKDRSVTSTRLELAATKRHLESAEERADGLDDELEELRTELEEARKLAAEKTASLKKKKEPPVAANMMRSERLQELRGKVGAERLATEADAAQVLARRSVESDEFKRQAESLRDDLAAAKLQVAELTLDRDRSGVAGGAAQLATELATAQRRNAELSHQLDNTHAKLNTSLLHKQPDPASSEDNDQLAEAKLTIAELNFEIDNLRITLRERSDAPGSKAALPSPSTSQPSSSSSLSRRFF